MKKDRLTSSDVVLWINEVQNITLLEEVKKVIEGRIVTIPYLPDDFSA